MTKVDNYLEKYLDGSISEGELQHFRDLFDTEPRLRTELLQTLELRSIIHDDLLILTPPEALSMVVRETLSEQFAELAEEEEEKRRPLFFPERIAGASLVAMVTLVLIALAPTLIAPSGSDRLAGLELPDIDPQATSTALLAEASNSQGSTPLLSSASQETRATASGISSLRTKRVSEPRQQVYNQADQSIAILDRSSIEADPNGFAEISDPEIEPNRSESVANESFLREDVDRHPSLDTESGLTIPEVSSVVLNGQSLRSLGENPDKLLASALSSPKLLDKTQPKARYGQGGDNGTVVVLRSNSRQIPMLGNSESSRRRIMFGGTLASGITTKKSTFSVQGSAYLALALGEKNRIGLEGGSAMFGYHKVGLEGGVEGEKPLHRFARSNIGPDDLSSAIESEGGSRVNSRAGGSLGEEQTDGRTASQPNRPQYYFHSYESEASMVYGLVFYDHKVTSVNKRLNIHGRVGVGGADGGIVLNARAYAAISTHENVAWTLGVGGSMLHEFSQEVDFNANYGVNAGVELGF
ncbi:MAG: hypothetical protein J4G05_02695 [Chlorobi bacterium]|nr:hypothetical protein [Chlorobiota bacterium]